MKSEHLPLQISEATKETLAQYGISDKRAQFEEFIGPIILLAAILIGIPTLIVCALMGKL